MSDAKLIRCQSHQQWLEERSKSIGSSDAAAILGASPFATPLSVYVSKVQPEPEVESEAMSWGHRLEAPIADEFADRNDPLQVEAPPKHSLFRLVGAEHLHATPDRLLHRIHAMGTVGVLEIKATRYRSEDWDEGVPLHVQVQVQHQLTVLGLDMAYVAVLIQGSEYRQFELTADKAFQSALLEKLSEFWRRVQNREPPTPTGAADYDTVKRMFRRASRKTVSLAPEVMFTFDAWEDAKAARLAIEKREKAQAARLMADLGDADEGVLPDGRRVTWKEETRNMPAQEARTMTVRTLRAVNPKEGRRGIGSHREKALPAGDAGDEVRTGTGEVPPGGEGDGI